MVRYPAVMHASHRPVAPSCLGPVEIDGMTVMLRTPRLSDGPSWRETNLRYEKRLAPAFGRTDMSWAAAHSPYMWIDTWKQALADVARGGASYLLVHLDAGRERVLGHLSMAGRHPRTGGTEVSTWTAGVPHTVTKWAQTSLIIAGFEANPDVPHAVAPLAVQNVAVQKLAESVGWSQLQTCRRLREYGGRPTDHQIWFQSNSTENLATLRRARDALSNNMPSSKVGRRTAVSWGDLVARGHYELRSRCRRTVAAAPDRQIEVVADRPAGTVEIAVDPGSSTTELIGRPRPDAPEDALTPTIADLAGRMALGPATTRRIVVAPRVDDQHLIGALAAHGFQSEGPTLPTLGESFGGRELWAYVAGI
ncbi:hypothetical protein BST43_24955 [Mycobacteroides saopaulense]|uniref:Uncharacterized protein n=2 Tax=Mycobacteroides saopaulense TaxID=1578165 RepID=A0A1X0IKG3_9MYCO|nr:hypothetical protein BST43_24955 [Mycobacteroides saopaulense]